LSCSSREKLYFPHSLPAKPAHQSAFVVSVLQPVEEHVVDDLVMTHAITRARFRKQTDGQLRRRLCRKYSFSREEQDKFAIASSSALKPRTGTAGLPGRFTPVAVKTGKAERFMERDEQPFKANFEKIPTLKPAFRKDGTVTAANSSSISDGAAALVMMRARPPRNWASRRSPWSSATARTRRSRVGLPPHRWARSKKLFDAAGWTAAKVASTKSTEAFAVVTMAAMKEHGLPHEKVNIHGGGLRARPPDRRLRARASSSR